MAFVRNKGRRLNKYVKDYVVFDIETTGLRPGLDEIIELSAVKVKNNEVSDTFSTLVKPTIRIPASATRINGITNDMVSSAPEIAEAMEGFVDFVETEILVGHNIHSFDTNFIYDAAMEAFQEGIYNDYIDTLYMARACLPQLKHHKLGDISEYFGISTEGAHRALNDCIMNQKCYEKMGELLTAQKKVKAEDKLVLTGKTSVSKDGMVLTGKTSVSKDGIVLTGRTSVPKDGIVLTGKTSTSEKEQMKQKASETQIEQVKNIQRSVRRENIPEEMSAEELWAVLENSCPECGGILVERKGRYGAFWGCKNFPRCRYTRKR